MVLASQYVENCAIVAGFSLTAYDYLLNIGLEFELIWRKRSWRTLMLYGIMRYAGLLWAIGTLLSVVNIQLSNTRCFLLKSLLETSEIIIVYLLQAMMAYRAYFVARNQMNSALLVTGFTIVQSLNGAALVVYLSSPVISDIHAFGSKSCSLATPSDAQWIYPLGIWMEHHEICRGYRPTAESSPSEQSHLLCHSLCRFVVGGPRSDTGYATDCRRLLLCYVIHHQVRVPYYDRSSNDAFPVQAGHRGFSTAWRGHGTCRVSNIYALFPAQPGRYADRYYIRMKFTCAMDMTVHVSVSFLYS